MELPAGRRRDERCNDIHVGRVGYSYLLPEDSRHLHARTGIEYGLIGVAFSSPGYTDRRMAGLVLDVQEEDLPQSLNNSGILTRRIPAKRPHDTTARRP